MNYPSSTSSRSFHAFYATNRARREPVRLTIARDGRMYSTSPPPTDKRTGDTPSDPILPVQQRSRKVDLRPGPVKPQAKLPADAAAHLRQTANATHTPADSSAEASFNSSPTPSTEGIISTAKHDIETAAQHGILAPPPPNAGRIGKLFHQAKELFVRSVLSSPNSFDERFGRNSTGEGSSLSIPTVSEQMRCRSG